MRTRIQCENHSTIGQENRKPETKGRRDSRKIEADAKVIGQRLADALEYMRAPKIVEKTGEEANVVEEVENVLAVWNRCMELRAALEEFQFETRVTGLFLSCTDEEGQVNERVWKALQAAMRRLIGHMSKIQDNTIDLMYPFEHGLGQISLAHFLVPKIPDDKDFGVVIEAAQHLDENLCFLMKRCVARLGAVAEKVEVVFGFEPMETPEEVKAENLQ